MSRRSVTALVLAAVSLGAFALFVVSFAADPHCVGKDDPLSSLRYLSLLVGVITALMVPIAASASRSTASILGGIGLAAVWIVAAFGVGAFFVFSAFDCLN
jgi:hypothetical protein